MVMAIFARQYYGNNDCYTDNNNRVQCYNSAWNSWVRWLVFALIVAAAFLFFFLFSCLSARRRRRLGYSPYRGTGWALGRTPVGHGPATYNAQPYYGNGNQNQTSSRPQQEQPYYNNSNNPPPPYMGNNGGGANAGYYGGGVDGRNNDVELQQPEATHLGAYKPPTGPPPGRY